MTETCHSEIAKHEKAFFVVVQILQSVQRGNSLANENLVLDSIRCSGARRGFNCTVLGGMPELAGAKDVGVVYEGGIVHDVELHDWWRIDRLFLYDESAMRASSPAGRSSLRTLFPSFDDNTRLLWLLTDPELIRVTGITISHRHESLAVC